MADPDEWRGRAEAAEAKVARVEATGPSVTFHDFAGSLGACAVYLRELADSETVLPANHGGRLWARWLAEQIETQTVQRAEVCARDVGDPPDVCRCLLPRGHSGLHSCKHTEGDA